MEAFIGYFFIGCAAYLTFLLFSLSTTVKTSRSEENTLFYFFKIPVFLLAVTAAFLALTHYGFIVQIPPIIGG